MTNLVDVERLEKLEAFVAKIAKGESHFSDQARALVAELNPVDPLLIQAREIVAGEYERSGPLGDQHRADWAKYCREGAYDTELAVVCTLAALRSVEGEAK